MSDYRVGSSSSANSATRNCITLSLSARGKLLRVGYSSVTVISIFRKFRASLFCHDHDQTVYFDSEGFTEW
jgi:hypothetical protein